LRKKKVYVFPPLLPGKDLSKLILVYWMMYILDFRADLGGESEVRALRRGSKASAQPSPSLSRKNKTQQKREKGKKVF
jgi:hypothetical protein